MEGDDRRRSFSEVVIGFSEEQSDALRDQDESFYGYSSDSSESDDSSDSCDMAERSPLVGSYVGSDAQENLDDSFLSEELDKASRQIFISGKLDTLANRGETLQHASVAMGGNQLRACIISLRSHQTKVCLAVFLFAYSVSRHELHTVQSHLDAGIVVPVRDANVGDKSWHAVTAEEVTKVRDFILNYESINGLPQPSAPCGHHVAAPTYLPSVSTKKSIHALYMKAGGTVSYQTFDKL